MRYLLTILSLVVSISSSAQFKLDLLAAGGLTLPTLHKEGAPRSSSRAGHYFAAGADFMFATSNKLFPYAGVRLSHHGFHYTEEFANGKLERPVNMLALSNLVGIQYRQPIGDRTALRLAAGAGAFVNAENMVNESGITGVGEVSAGLQWHALTVGVKLVKPWSSYRQKHTFGQSVQFVKGEGFNDYTLHSVALELKVTPRPPSGMSMRERPSRPVRRGPSGYESTRRREGRMEVGLAAGPAIVRVVDRGRYGADASSGGIGMLVMDKYVNTRSHVACFAHGFRLGFDPFGLYTSYVIGLHINTAPTGDFGFRISAMAGPMFNNFKPNMAAEGTVSVLLNQRISLGVKYMRPWYEVSDKYYREPWNGSDYRVDYLLGEVKVRIGKR